MPRSKRNKIVSLTKTEKKGKEYKQQLIENIRQCFDKYRTVIVFSLHNTRTNQLKDIRLKYRDTSRFFLGKNKVMAVALGRNEEEEHRENTHFLSEHLRKECGLMFTNEKKDDVIEFLRSYREKDYARAGFCATETIELPAGVLEQFTHDMEPYLRMKLQLPTSLRDGKVYLERDFTVCKEGEALTPEQAKLLQLLGIKMSEFTLTPVCVWSEGNFEELSSE